MKRKILLILNSLNCGGQENFVMNYYRLLDKNKFEVAFLVPEYEKTYYFEEEIINNSDRIFRVTSKSRNPFKCYREIKKIVKKYSFDVVHRHSGNSLMCFDLLAAKRGGAKVLIAHSHSSSTLSAKGRILHKIFVGMLNTTATCRLACSDKAGKWMYRNKDFRIINNGIDAEKYVFNSEVRSNLRVKLNISNEVVLGHVGRFSEVKNHEFIIDILYELKKMGNYKYKLLLLGEGELKEKILNKVEKMGLENEVIFLGNQRNVHEWLQVMDAFVFPSLYEGLPLSVVEAQASGTKVFASDRISTDCKVTDVLEFLSIDEGTSLWVDKIDLFAASCYEKSNNIEQIRTAQMDIIQTKDYLEEIYSERK